ncbi:MAG: hypothetical protein ABMA64_31580 [Myxococcota bacterium]
MLLPATGARAADDVTFEAWRAQMRREAHAPDLLPYVVDGDTPRVAVVDGQILGHAAFAELVGDTDRAREVASLQARDRRWTRASMALTGGSLALLFGGMAADSVPMYAGAVGLSVGGLALALPPAIPGRKVKALRYTAAEAEAAAAR